MGIFDKLTTLATENLGKAKALASQNSDKISGGLSKATAEINKRTDGKYADKLDKVTSTVESKLAEAETTVDDAATDDAATVDLTAEEAAAAEAKAPGIDSVSNTAE